MRLRPCERTLVVQPLPGIGDMVWHLPHLHAIAAATTTTGRVDVLTKPRSQADRLLQADPTIERIVWLDREGGHAGWIGFRRLVRLLRQGGYQRIWLLHGSARYGLAAWWAGIPQRLGYGFGLQRLLLSQSVSLSSALHHAHPIRRADALLAAFDIPSVDTEPRLAVAAVAQQAVTEQFAAWPAPWIALGIGSSEPAKQWGAGRFAELALALRQQSSGSILLVGGSAEQALALEILRRIEAGGGVGANASALPLEQTAALLAHCRCYIGNDTGGLNMAAALQVPALGLFGASEPLFHSRWIEAITPPHGQTGMAAITVDRVLARLDPLGWLT